MKLKNILNEMLSEEYPQSWNWDDFKALNGFSDRKKYCDQHLKFLVSGSGRLVYKVDDDKVLKLAKNKKGVAQCEVEISLGNDSYIDHIVAPIFEYDEDGLWVEMSIAQKLTKGKFESLMGYSFDNFAQEMKRFYYENIKNSKGIRFSHTDEHDVIIEDEFYSGMCDLMGSYDMPVGDLARLNSFGVIIKDNDERVALIDYGLTNDVYDNYYK